MDAERWQRVEWLYHAALERKPARRTTFLEESCGLDQDLRREVEEMLALGERHESFLERPALEIALGGDGMTTGQIRLAFEAALARKAGGSGGKFCLDPGARLGPYEVVKPAGAGGMGEIYSARDTRLGRVVALKVLTGRLTDQAGSRRRFEAEAQAISSLNHPNICTLYDIGHHEGIDYLVMEYLEGQTLATRLKQGPVPYAELLRVAIEVSGALAYAHEHGVIHRDVKPGNIMLTDFGAKLLDFGLARWAEEAGARNSVPLLPADSSLTVTGLILGTPQYMAPEQIERREIDARTDIFALGTVIFEMATGRKAFEGGTAGEIINAIQALEPPGLASPRSEIPVALQGVIHRCLKKSPEERWQSAGDLNRELKRIEPAVSRITVRRNSKFQGRVAAVVVLVILAAGIALRTMNRRRPAIADRVLHPFTGQDGDGAGPASSVVAGTNGTLYGTTRYGGTFGKGTIFELKPSAATGAGWTERVLYSFTGGSDGSDPIAGLVVVGSGLLYGTTLGGGTSGQGTVFELTPPATPVGSWTERVLHNFSRQNGDGADPRPGLAIGKNGALYGTTFDGGVPVESGFGTVFELTPPSTPGGAWAEKVLYRFTGENGDGAYPYGDVVIGEDGTIYGTTFGGASGSGTIFKLTAPSSQAGAWKETVLHGFTGQDGDGASPVAGLVIGKSGTLYGTTQWGGISRNGTVFELKPPETAGEVWVYAVLHRFTSHAGDGAEPTAGLVVGKDGALYGATLKGGTWGNGALFKLTPRPGSWIETVLYSFTGQTGDGANVQCIGHLLLDSSGALYGTTEFGGASSAGTVFKLPL
jgi:uncharacterized repeat protein (TIGR03803 family)